MNEHKRKRLGQVAKSRSRTRLKESWFLLFITLHYRVATKNITSPNAKKTEHEYDKKCSKTMSICPCLVFNSSLSVSRFLLEEEGEDAFQL